MASNHIPRVLHAEDYIMQQREPPSTARNESKGRARVAASSVQDYSEYQAGHLMNDGVDVASAVEIENQTKVEDVPHCRRRLGRHAARSKLCPQSPWRHHSCLRHPGHSPPHLHSDAGKDLDKPMTLSHTPRLA